MGIYNKNRGTNISGVFEFPNGATLTSTSTSTTEIIASSKFTATNLSVTSSFAGVSGSFSTSLLLPYVSTTSTGTAGMIGYSTSSAKLVFALATGNWAIVSTA